MLGVELVSDRKLKTPAKAETPALFEKMKGTAVAQVFHPHESSPSL